MQSQVLNDFFECNNKAVRPRLARGANQRKVFSLTNARTSMNRSKTNGVNGGQYVWPLLNRF